MKTSILAILLCLTGAFAQANDNGNGNDMNQARLVYKCDQKHGHHDAKIYYYDSRFFICFEPLATNATPNNEAYCNNKVWSTDVDHKDDMIMIDFQHDWMFEGDKRSGVLWNDDMSYTCARPHHGGDQNDDDQNHTQP